MYAHILCHGVEHNLAKNLSEERCFIRNEVNKEYRQESEDLRINTKYVNLTIKKEKPVISPSYETPKNFASTMKYLQTAIKGTFEIKTSICGIGSECKKIKKKDNSKEIFCEKCRNWFHIKCYERKYEMKIKIDCTDNSFYCEQC